MSDGQAAGVADRFDLPGDSRGSLALHVVAPERNHALDKPAWRVDLKILSLAEEFVRIWVSHLIARAGRPIRADPQIEGVFAPSLAVGDRFPEALWGSADVDLENLLHALLQSVLEPTKRCSPGLGVLAHPSVVDEPDRDRVQEMEFLAPSSPGYHQARLLELPQVLHHAETRHREAPLERAQRLPVLTEELVEQSPPSRISEGLEHRVHAGIICDYLVTYQAPIFERRLVLLDI